MCVGCPRYRVPYSLTSMTLTKSVALDPLRVCPICNGTVYFAPCMVVIQLVELQINTFLSLSHILKDHSLLAV